MYINKAKTHWEKICCRYDKKLHFLNNIGHIGHQKEERRQRRGSVLPRKGNPKE